MKNPAYLVVILLSRVVIRLGGIGEVNPKTIEGLFAADLAYLQNLYNEINRLEDGHPVVCPHCEREFVLEMSSLGG
jgi:hypothetical protein